MDIQAKYMLHQYLGIVHDTSVIVCEVSEGEMTPAGVTRWPPMVTLFCSAKLRDPCAPSALTDEKLLNLKSAILCVVR
jgi:hypothetical protein